MSAPSAIELALDASGTTTARCMSSWLTAMSPFLSSRWHGVRLAECRSERPEI